MSPPAAPAPTVRTGPLDGAPARQGAGQGRALRLDLPGRVARGRAGSVHTA